MAALSTYEEVREYLYSLRHHGAKYGIDRMRALAERLGHPERAYPTVHIAGTNGKGSTCAMLEAIYRAAGYKTGLYTSPHLVEQGERVQVNRQNLSRAEIVDYVRELQPHAEALGAHDPDLYPSFFEFMTAMAFLHFARQQVQVGVIEVGLGGRLDATNIIVPEVSAITSIGLDHCEILGDTHAKIAFEKAGVVKPKRPVVLGHLPPAAEEVIRAVARERGAPVTAVREVFGDDPAACPATVLPGDYQRWNAATATLVARLAQPRLPVSEVAIAQGLVTVTWAGRWDVRAAGDRQVVLDTSHNEEGARTLDANLAGLIARLGYRPAVVVGALGLPRAQALLPVVARHAREIFLVRPRQPRASTFAELRACLPANFAGPVHDGELRALFPAPGQCTIGQPGETVVVTGSIYLVGEVLEALQQTHRGDGHLLQDSLAPITTARTAYTRNVEPPEYTLLGVPR